LANLLRHATHFLTFMEKVMESIVTIDLDENEKITRLVDQWDGKEPPTRYGAYWARRANARLLPWLVHVPK
jgi:hypothetical protein